MSEIQQIYCTHCTHGNSALERREGDHAHRMLGYSARAGSLEAAELRRCYRQVERHVYYYLPRDTPADAKVTLTAATAPRRLMYVPSAGDVQLAGQVCYRAFDTEGRPGSYFAHVVFADHREGAPGWSPRDCLRLWHARGWVEEDSPDIDFLVNPLSSLDELLEKHRAAIDDGVLRSLVTAPAGGPFDDPGRVIPERWRRQEPRSRQALLVDVLAFLLELDLTNRDSLLLVVEPELAALLFYGALRLLPDVPWTQAISFCTFEPNPDQRFTTLAATCFYDPAGELPAEVYAGLSPVWNTFTGRRSPLRHPEGRYAGQMVARLVGPGWAAVDEFRENARAAGVRSGADLERLTAIDQALPQLFEKGGKTPFSLDWRGDPLAEAYLRRMVGGILAAWAGQEAKLNRVVGGANHLLLLELAADSTSIPQARPAVEYLLRTLPAERVSELLRLESVAAKDKIVALLGILKGMDATALVALLAEHGPKLLADYPADEPLLGKRLQEIVRQLPEPVAEFSRRLDVLLLARHLLPDETEQHRVGHWQACREAIRQLGVLQAERTGPMRRRPTEALEKACRQLAVAAAAAMSPDLIEEDPMGLKRENYLRQLGPVLLGGARLLPAGPALHEALWAKIRWLFKHGSWSRTPLDRMGPGGKRAISRQALAGILAAVLVLAAGIGGFAWIDSWHSPAKARPAKPLAQAADAKTGTEENEKRAAKPTPSGTTSASTEQQADAALEQSRRAAEEEDRRRRELAERERQAQEKMRSDADAQARMNWLARQSGQPVPAGSGDSMPATPAAKPAESPQPKPPEVPAPSGPPAAEIKPAEPAGDKLASAAGAKPAAVPLPEPGRESEQASRDRMQNLSLRIGGMFLEHLPLVDGSVAPAALQSLDATGLCLGEGRLAGGEKIYPFGVPFQQQPPANHQELSALARSLGLESISVTLQRQEGTTRLVVEPKYKYLPTDVSDEVKEEVATLTDRKQRVFSLLRMKPQSEDAQRSWNEKMLGLLEIRLPEMPAEPNAGDPRWKNDQRQISAAYDHYRDQRAAVEQQRGAILDHLRATAADTVSNLQSEVKKIQAQVQAQKEEVGRRNDEARQALYQRCTQLSVIVYRAAAAGPANAAAPAPAVEPASAEFGVFKVESRPVHDLPEGVAARLRPRLVDAAGSAIPPNAGPRERFQADCFAFLRAEDGRVQEKHSGGVANFEAVDIAEGVKKVEFQFVFYRNLPQGERKDREIRRSMRMALAEVQAGVEYEVRLELTAEQLELLRGPAGTVKREKVF